ncbi:GntR family transcriptional regulator [Tessaracoccus sp. OS52]|uniref:GntR family transcriptional regulator n=1 Tax=Tessaracoccus sp. OS52 TaxID=2886691 RepID=UPI001D12E6B8|nr:GntR family transcriptional regulator [Tessaracoccus sp. OS52]MCC2593926.1 GntR family transcriptional regulator [Tessaracoccus sp. OS52]
MLIRIDPSSDEPVFAQLAASIRADVVTGRLSVGERLPAAKEVAASLGINLHTVLRSYQELRAEGLVDMRRGRGAVITEAAASTVGLQNEIRALVRRAESLGVSRATLAGLVRDAPSEGERDVQRSGR